jgi:hypothetical protein
VPAVPITISHSRFGATGQIQLPCTAGQPYRYRIFLRLVFRSLVFLRLLTQNRREFLPSCFVPTAADPKQEGIFAPSCFVPVFQTASLFHRIAGSIGLCPSQLRLPVVRSL